jgi:hypothetical protein
VPTLNCTIELESCSLEFPHPLQMRVAFAFDLSAIAPGIALPPASMQSSPIR